MSCRNYVTYLNCGINEIILSDLTPNEVRQVNIEHPNGAIYTNEYEVDAFGDLTIPVSNYPPSFFNPYAGAFILTLNGEGCMPYMFCEEYLGIQFEMRNGNGFKNTLKCCESGANSGTMSCCEIQRIPFTEEAVTVIQYTGVRPSIEVAYLNPDGTFTLGSMGINTHVTFSNTEITIDHGGVSSGIVKLTK